jgi:cytochrome c oxidase cbb3-type subunit 1
MVWFPWVFITANTLIHCLKGHPIMAAGINAWFHSAFIFLFFVPVGLGVSYYLAPKVTGRPIVSYSLSKFGFWALAIIAPWAGFQKLAGAPIPYFIPYVGAAAAILLFIPLCAAAVNILRTIASNSELSVKSPTLRFAAAGGIGFVVLGFTGLLLNWPGSTLQLTQFTISNYGFDLLAIYGFFTLTMFAGIYFIVPRITCTEWISAKAIQLHFLLSVYGVVSISIVTLFGGMMQGSAQEDFKVAWTSASDYSRPYSVAISVAWGLILVSNIIFFIHLVRMWLNGGLNQADPTLIEASHSSPPHGSDGDIDNAGPGYVSAH